MLYSAPTSKLLFPNVLFEVYSSTSIATFFVHCKYCHIVSCRQRIIFPLNFSDLLVFISMNRHRFSKDIKWAKLCAVKLCFSSLLLPSSSQPLRLIMWATSARTIVKCCMKIPQYYQSNNNIILQGKSFYLLGFYSTLNISTLWYWYLYVSKGGNRKSCTRVITRVHLCSSRFTFHSWMLQQLTALGVGCVYADRLCHCHWPCSSLAYRDRRA